ncbi:MAG: RluA family pseudouridine synthase [Acidobacteria bacterium]|nr:MAG: RluA family pseudouridine synthase [Acidobacteriota bacterium]
MAAPENRRVTVAERDDDARLDQVLARELKDLSRSQLQRLIHDGHVRIARAAPKSGAAEIVPAKAGYRVMAADQITVVIPPREATTLAAENLPIDVIYQDADLAIINKPAGLVVHPAVGHGRGTLVNALLHHLKGLSSAGGSDRPGIVHRLDKGTSGVMVVAKNDAAHRALAKQFHDRLVTKEYVALVWGVAKAGTTLDKAIGRDPRHRMKMSTRGRHTRAASTTIVSSTPFRGVSLVTVRIGTGRTHQIRVHLSESGHAVVGDETYGGVKKHPPAHLKILSTLERPFLHARAISFAHPRTGKTVSFEAPLAPDLQQILDQL